MKNQTNKERLIGEIADAFIYGRNGSLLSIRDMYKHQCAKSRRILTTIADEHSYRLRNPECTHELMEDENNKTFCPVCHPSF